MLHAFVLAAVLNGTVVFRPQSGENIAAGGVAIGGALVEILQDRNAVAFAISATDGTFSFPDVAPGKYSIQIFSNHTTTTGTIVVHDVDPNLGADASRTFYVFDAPCGAVFGRVRNQVTGLGVPHAVVWFLGNSDTDANGDYFITLGCWDPGWSFKYTGTSGMIVVAPGYQEIWWFVRSEAVTNGMEGRVIDFELQPLVTPPDHDRLRPDDTRRDRCEAGAARSAGEGHPGRQTDAGDGAGRGGD